MRSEIHSSITERIKALGFPSLSAYLNARIGVPYPDLADELGDGVLGMHLAALHMQQADDCRTAAADSLVRALRQVLSNGWDLTDSSEPGVDRGFVNMTAWSYWGTSLGRCSPGEEVLDRIWESIRGKAKPGWLPTTAEDPVIAEAFDAAWPRKG